MIQKGCVSLIDKLRTYCKKTWQFFTHFGQLSLNSLMRLIFFVGIPPILFTSWALSNSYSSIFQMSAGLDIINHQVVSAVQTLSSISPIAIVNFILTFLLLLLSWKITCELTRIGIKLVLNLSSLMKDTSDFLKRH